MPISGDRRFSAARSHLCDALPTEIHTYMRKFEMHNTVTQLESEAQVAGLGDDGIRIK